MKQNKAHDEQIIVAKLWQKSLSDKNQVPFMNKKNDFFVNCYGNKFGDVYRIWMTEYQTTNV